MKRPFFLSALVALLIATALPAGAEQEDPSPAEDTSEKATEETSPAEPEVHYVLDGEARGLEIALGDQGVTLGAAIATADSTPKASGLGAGQCDFLGERHAPPQEAPCNEATGETSAAPGDEGRPGERCAAPPLPAPLDTVLDLSLACGSSESKIVNGVPTSANHGRLGTLRANLDLSGVSPELQDAKAQIIDGLEELIGNLPEEAQTLFDEILDTLDAGEALRIDLGPARSDITADGDSVGVLSTAKGTAVGLLGIPELDEEGNPIPGTANALENGLITIEIGDAYSQASLDRTDISATADAKAALVRLRVLDITKNPPVYEEIEVAPGETQTILPDTPLESTITAADSQTAEEEGTARAGSDAVSLHLLKGVGGGISLGLARTTAATSVEVEEPDQVKPRQPTEPLPATGGTDGLVLIVLLSTLALVGVLVVRRMVRR